MRYLIIAVLVAAPIAVHPQTLYRCVEKDKPTSFQAEPCPATAKTASAVDYLPDPDARPYQPAAAPSVPSPQRERRRQVAGGQLHQVTVAPRPAACSAARAAREAALGRNNQGGNVDLRRRLNDAVARACY